MYGTAMKAHGCRVLSTAFKHGEGLDLQRGAMVCDDRQQKTVAVMKVPENEQ